MNEMVLTILVALLGSSGLFTVIQLLLNRYFSKKDKIDEVSQSLSEIK